MLRYSLRTNQAENLNKFENNHPQPKIFWFLQTIVLIESPALD